MQEDQNNSKKSTRKSEFISIINDETLKEYCKNDENILSKPWAKIEFDFLTVNDCLRS